VLRRIYLRNIPVTNGKVLCPTVKKRCAEYFSGLFEKVRGMETENVYSSVSSLLLVWIINTGDKYYAIFLSKMLLINRNLTDSEKVSGLLELYEHVLL
jgi:hypothetical protein